MILNILIIMVIVTQNITVFAASKTELKNEQSEIDREIEKLKGESKSSVSRKLSKEDESDE